MHILVTGANGFIGKHLTLELLRLAQKQPSRWPIKRLTVMDFRLDQLPEHPLLNRVAGSFADADTLATALSEKADLVFHLASVPSGRSETDPTLGMSVNVHGTLHLLDALKAQSNQAMMVFASSIAVYGKPQVPLVNDETLPTPTLSYGAHKVIGEVLVNDYARRGWIRGCSLRLPGIVTRPPEPNGAVSIFLSNLIRELRNGRPFICPTTPDAHTWLMSIGCCVDNLINAALQEFTTRRTFMLPAQHVRLGSLVQAIADEFRVANMKELIRWSPDEWVQFNFGSYPPVSVPASYAHGFRADADLRALVVKSLVD